MSLNYKDFVWLMDKRYVLEGKCFPLVHSKDVHNGVIIRSILRQSEGPG